MTSPIASATRNRGNDRSTIDETTASSRQTRNSPSMTTTTPTTDGSSKRGRQRQRDRSSGTGRQDDEPDDDRGEEDRGQPPSAGDEVAEAGDQRAEQPDAEPGDPAARRGTLRRGRSASRATGRRRSRWSARRAACRRRWWLGQGRLGGRLDLGGRIVGGQGRLLCATGSPRSRTVGTAGGGAVWRVARGPIRAALGAAEPSSAASAEAYTNVRRGLERGPGRRRQATIGGSNGGATLVGVVRRIGRARARGSDRRPGPPGSSAERPATGRSRRHRPPRRRPPRRARRADRTPSRGDRRAASPSGSGPQSMNRNVALTRPMIASLTRAWRRLSALTLNSGVAAAPMNRPASSRSTPGGASGQGDEDHRQRRDVGRPGERPADAQPAR